MKLVNIIRKIFRFVLTCGHPEIKIYPKVSVLASNSLLSGRTALITGGTSGIGYHIACAFVNSGCNVIITGRDSKRINDACDSIKQKFDAGAKVLGIVINNLEVNSFEENLKEAISLSPSKEIDILVNNAGVNGGHFSQCTEEEYDKILETNLKGPFFLTKVFAKYLINNKIEGNILNVASASSLRPADSAYCLSKWGIRGFTEGCARSLAPYNIVVNGIAPGPTATSMLLEENKDDYSWPVNLTKRMAMPEEIANMSVILVSHLSRMIVGDIVYMTGGGGNITNEDVKYYF